MAKKKIVMDYNGLLNLLEDAYEKAEEHRTEAMGFLSDIKANLHLTRDRGLDDTVVIMAVTEISETIERYLRQSDNSVDKMIKIAKIMADVLNKRDQSELEDENLTEDEREELLSRLNSIAEEESSHAAKRK